MAAGIHAEDIGKYYPLHRAGDSGLTRAVARRFRSSPSAPGGVWALRDLNFTIREGESVGIIGLNGAGKSTLFKILSLITKPTRGNLDIRGNVGALIELGAGFHPELSGRENIFLYGSILGMKRELIAKRLEEIIAFSELEAFIDAPIKRYSSGMFLRLGFSVAAHLYPDILLIDEILSVGDLRFQKKCFDWVHGYLTSRRILLLISHQIHRVESICKRVFYMKGGRLAFDGPSDQAISRYLNDLGFENDLEKINAPIPGYQARAGEFAISSVSLRNGRDQPADTVFLDEDFTIRIDYDAPVRIEFPKVEIAVRCEGRKIGQANTISDAAAPSSLQGKGSIYFRWPRCFLAPNVYTVDLFVSDGKTMADLLKWKNCIKFQVAAQHGFRIASGDPGWIRIPGHWSFR